jgi:hypothetical protein
MKTLLRLTLLFLIVCGFVYLGTAQVKIGDNPNTINANSLLELESTNKGFLCPRVAINSLSLPSPLTAPVTAGMLVYSTGGIVSDGYYSWDGVKWVKLLTSAIIRNNYVIVKSASDFPASVSGVITLVAGTLYEINGTIVLSDKIDMNGCSVTGGDPLNDKLVYTGTGELFTGSNAGNLKFLTLVAASGKVFNVNGGGAAKNFIVQNCYILGCNTVGTIQGYAGTVYFGTVAYFSNQNGVTFTNNTNVLLNNMLWDVSNYNTYETFSGTFNAIQILGGDRYANLSNTATALDISGITSLSVGSLKVVLFVGTGTYVMGSFTNAWEAEATGISTEKDDVASGNIYLNSPTTSTFTAINTPTKILGTTTAVSLFRATSPSNNRMTYTGAKIRRFQVMGSMSMIASGSNKNFSFYIAKNGVVLPESKQWLKLNASSDRDCVALSCTVQLAPNDYIEVWVENNSDATSVSVESMNLSMK